MQIEKVKFTDEEINQIFDSLIERFDLNNSNVFEKGQTIEFELNELINIESTLELYNEGYYESETNAPIISSQSVIKFKLAFLYDGDEVKTNCDLEERINNHYRI